VKKIKKLELLALSQRHPRASVNYVADNSGLSSLRQAQATVPNFVPTLFQNW